MIGANSKRLIFATCLTIGFSMAKGQITDPKVLFTVDGQPVTVEEFKTVYLKNNTNKNAFSEKDIREYLELYTKFKVKVKEAYEKKLDTVSAYKNELANYRNQLAQPYLKDKQTIETLVKEAYDRMLKEVHASHILIMVNENASPKDTADAFRRISAVRDRLLKGEDFGTVAADASEDPSARQNKGDLGWFTVFRMIYPFENMAYQTANGKFSPIFRTQFGYHIIYKQDERPSRGEVRASHIMVLSRPNDSDSIKQVAQTRIDEIYRKLQAGGKFEDLAKQYSEDPSSARNGGALPWFGTGRMVPEFEDASFALANAGDYTKPFRTQYGWHIVQLHEKRGIAKFEDLKTELNAKVERDMRAFSNRQNLVKKLKKEYGLKEIAENRQTILSAVDSNLTKGSWKADSAQLVKWNKPVIQLGAKTDTIITLVGKVKKKTFNTKYDLTLTQADFARYLIKNQTQVQDADPSMLALKMYDTFLEQEVINFEDSRLENKYPDFHNLMNEYREGILLFDLTDKMVWTKASQDTTGLKAFYEENKEKYKWGERIDGGIYYCASEKIANKVRKDVEKGKLTGVQLLQKYAKDNPLNLRIEENKYERSANDIVSRIEWKPGLSENMNINNNIVFVNVKRLIAPEPKLLPEIRGIITSEYQMKLEKEWIADLMARHKVVVNETAVNAIIK